MTSPSAASPWEGRILESGLPPGVEGTVATVGTFDGVHLGHRAILRELERKARSRSLRSLLVTFDRHPLEVVRPTEAPPLLTTREEKIEILAQWGPDYVAFLPFTRTLSRYEPEDFVRRVLLARFHVRELVIGPDHGFGRSRSGDLNVLRRLGGRLGFAVDVVPEVEVEGGPISSTRIRERVAVGEVEEVARLLGRPYTLRGRVIRGMGRGRGLGFPTANLETLGGRKLLPGAGIYAVRAGLPQALGRGLLHLGPRPVFPGAGPSVELHLLEFEGDLYEAEIQVEFLARLRDVRPFESTEALVREMQRDREWAVRYFRDRAARAPEVHGGVSE